jgi:hypothetical protein
MMFCVMYRPIVTLLRRFLPILTAAGLCMSLVACQPSVEVVSPTRTVNGALLSGAVTSPLPVATVVPAAHAVGIVGVDFDPPLDDPRFLSNGGVTLLVAIENQGVSAESNITVTARLLDPHATADESPLLHEAVNVKTLAPGEVRVVRFSQVTDLPLRSRYKLRVELTPAPGEDDLADNSRAYDIVVRAGE